MSKEMRKKALNCWKRHSQHLHQIAGTINARTFCKRRRRRIIIINASRQKLSRFSLKIICENKTWMECHLKIIRSIKPVNCWYYFARIIVFLLALRNRKGIRVDSRRWFCFLLGGRKSFFPFLPSVYCFVVYCLLNIAQWRLWNFLLCYMKGKMQPTKVVTCKSIFAIKINVFFAWWKSSSCVIVLTNLNFANWNEIGLATPRSLLYHFGQNLCECSVIE